MTWNYDVPLESLPKAEREHVEVLVDILMQTTLGELVDQWRNPYGCACPGGPSGARRCFCHLHAVATRIAFARCGLRPKWMEVQA